jgi:hypothetical protein
MKRSLLGILLCSTLVFAGEPTVLSLNDFTDTNGEAPAGGWTQEEGGIIHLRGKGGSLISKVECASFELEWEWKVSEKGNNGIKYWVTKVGGKEWLGIEYQMIDDNGHPDGLRGGSHTTASIYDIKEPVKDKGAKPAGEWNKSKILVDDGKIQHLVFLRFGGVAQFYFQSDTLEIHISQRGPLLPWLKLTDLFGYSFHFLYFFQKLSQLLSS